MVFYFTLLLVEIVAEALFFYTNNASLIYITKPLLMPTLIAWAFLFAAEQNISFNKTIYIALIFSLFGDIALMFLSIEPDIFIVGLASFLIAHVIYIVLFINIPSKHKSILILKPYLLVPITLLGFSFIICIRKTILNLLNYKFPY